MNKDKRRRDDGIQYRDMPCEGSLSLRQTIDGGESRTIEGMAIVFNSPSVPFYEDSETVLREQISPEAITQALLDSSDILCTLYHDNTRILARSLKGSGTLSYELTEAGVRFHFDPPETADGKTALELVKRGEINGCSFAFGIKPGVPGAEERTVKTLKDGRKEITYTVKKIEYIRDFTLTPRPRYEATAVETRLRDLEAIEKREPESVGEDAKADMDWLDEIINR